MQYNHQLANLKVFVQSLSGYKPFKASSTTDDNFYQALLDSVEDHKDLIDWYQYQFPDKSEEQVIEMIAKNISNEKGVKISDFLKINIQGELELSYAYDERMDKTYYLEFDVV